MAKAATKKKKATRSTPWTKFKRHIEHLKSMFPGRDAEIDVMALALMTKTHAFFLSPPGTAKSAIIRQMSERIGMQFFGIQMRDDTKVEELFGMWDIKELTEHSRYKRNWSRAAISEILYVNECFKGSSNALNAMLGLLNEREVDDDNSYRKCPLWSALLDSNELPRDRNMLTAFFDRIMFKRQVTYIEDKSDFEDLILGSAGPQKSPPPLERGDMEKIHTAVQKVEVPSWYVDAIYELRNVLSVEQVIVSDRTWAVACGTHDFNGVSRASPIKAHALWNGRREVEPDDLAVLCDIFWSNSKDKGTINKAVTAIKRQLTKSVTVAAPPMPDKAVSKRRTPGSDANQIATLKQKLSVIKSLGASQDELADLLRDLAPLVQGNPAAEALYKEIAQMLAKGV